MSKVTIELSSPIAGPRGAIKTIGLREPNDRDYVDFGEPVSVVSLAGGGSYFQETSTIVGAYIERLCDIDPNMLELAAFEDVLALREAALDFFRSARMARAIREAAKTSSSSADGSFSASASTPGPSKI